jgi:hypothetical protein
MAEVELEEILDRFKDGWGQVGSDSQEDGVRRIRAELARLRDLARWIPVGERLPEQGQECAVRATITSWISGVGTYDTRAIGTIGKNGTWFLNCEPTGSENVTHWMPLPPDPEGK